MATRVRQPSDKLRQDNPLLLTTLKNTHLIIKKKNSAIILKYITDCVQSDFWNHLYVMVLTVIRSYLAES